MAQIGHSFGRHQLPLVLPPPLSLAFICSAFKSVCPLQECRGIGEGMKRSFFAKQMNCGGYSLYQIHRGMSALAGGGVWRQRCWKRLSPQAGSALPGLASARGLTFALTFYCPHRCSTQLHLHWLACQRDAFPIPPCPLGSGALAGFRQGLVHPGGLSTRPVRTGPGGCCEAEGTIHL